MEEDFEGSSGIINAWPSAQVLGLWTALLVVLLSLFHLWWHHPMYGKNKGPKVYPIFGSFIEVLWILPTIFDWAADRMSETENLTIRVVKPGGVTTYITGNPDNVEHILKTNFQNYPKGEYFQNNLHDYLGDGILNADGELWRLQRRVASSEFSTQSLRTFMMDIVHEEIKNRLLPILSRASQEGDLLDLQDIIKRFTFDNACQLALGVDIACLDMSLPVLEFEKAIDDASEVSASRFSNIPVVWSTMRALNIGSERKLQEAMASLGGFVMSVIQERRKQMQGDNAFSNGSDLLSRFMGAKAEGSEEGVESSGFSGDGAASEVRSTTKKQEVLTDEFLRDMVISFLQAGRDTSAVSLSWFFWLLTCNPRVEEAIYEEISRVHHKSSLPTADNSESREVSGIFSFEQLKEMHYLQAALTESMRMYAPVPSNLKVAKEDDVWPDGTRIPKSTMVGYHPYAMGRLEKLWGSDCLEFKPERWLKDGVFVPPNPYKYPVFQAGPRICLGKDMAIIQMKSVAAAILTHFTFSVPAGYKPVYALSFVLTIKNGLPAYVHRRSPSRT